ncbi:MAG: lipoyl synthase [Verrucomicrobia bacterium]|nr:MAG: lipoyl synthase [Verrucomicrobiota bacterium]
MPGLNLAEVQARPRLPAWLRRQLPATESFARMRALLDELKLHTVCQSARCPNHWECWSKGTATFMIAGDHCTRACRFCAVTTAKPLALEADEPARVAEATRRLRLKHVVVTAVARDDLPDGGADHFRRTIEAVRALNPATIIEVLTPDFDGREASIETVLAAQPHIFNHNLETVRRLTPSVRWRATYERSLAVLQQVKLSRGATIYTKSGLMLGLGETEAELFTAMADLRRVGCDILTLGQYLQPTLQHLPVVEFVSPDKFQAYGQHARQIDFVHVASGPMVRSSYHADDFSPLEPPSAANSPSPIQKGRGP